MKKSFFVLLFLNLLISQSILSFWWCCKTSTKEEQTEVIEANFGRVIESGKPRTKITHLKSKDEIFGDMTGEHEAGRVELDIKESFSSVVALILQDQKNQRQLFVNVWDAANNSGQAYRVQEFLKSVDCETMNKVRAVMLFPGEVKKQDNGTFQMEPWSCVRDTWENINTMLFKKFKASLKLESYYVDPCLSTYQGSPSRFILEWDRKKVAYQTVADRWQQHTIWFEDAKESFDLLEDADESARVDAHAKDIPQVSNESDMKV